MKKVMSALFIVFFLITLIKADNADYENAMRFSYPKAVEYEGLVFFSAADGVQKVISTNELILPGDEINTDKDSSVRIMLDNAFVIELYPNSKLKFSSPVLSNSLIRLRLIEGQAFVSKNKGFAVCVKTKNAVVNARAGGHFIIKEKPALCEVAAISGTVEVENDYGRLQVLEYQGAYARGSAAPGLTGLSAYAEGLMSNINSTPALAMFLQDRSSIRLAAAELQEEIETNEIIEEISAFVYVEPSRIEGTIDMTEENEEDDNAPKPAERREYDTNSAEYQAYLKRLRALADRVAAAKIASERNRIEHESLAQKSADDEVAPPAIAKSEEKDDGEKKELKSQLQQAKEKQAELMSALQNKNSGDDKFEKLKAKKLSDAATLRKKAESAYGNGEYDKSLDYSRQAWHLIRQVKEDEALLNNNMNSVAENDKDEPSILSSTI